MQKKIIVASTTVLLVAFSGFGLSAITTSYDVPASVSIRRNDVSGIVYSLHNT